ncbi:hypothetical protein R3W88_014816 [Solanum pinnatisectum]|uniref:Uncharacterized protein n=1 Tax=Solanum pinnatisectum TaxID=50273 RepID=A0AAV9KTH9_9SOLN|nr:hypothetical protein R3W88_014816 [Solanum pinnatisectum]
MSLPCGSCGCGRDEKKFKHTDEIGFGSDLKAEDGESDGEPEYDSDDWRTWPDRDFVDRIKGYASLECTVTAIVKLKAGCPHDFA